MMACFDFLFMSITMHSCILDEGVEAGRGRCHGMAGSNSRVEHLDGKRLLPIAMSSI